MVSSLGKGISAAALGALLQARGYKVRLRKLDPYLNVDPGTMNPNQHGEVFVTDDGAETDLDLGHYERFTGVNATKHDNITAGKIYQQVISNERKGIYLGKTVQVIPHVTNAIIENMLNLVSKEDFLIVEVGGTVGDIESLPFLESIRQLRNTLSNKRTLFIHCTLIPYLSVTDELKTKPTQHSVKELREIGIQPDILICRCEKSISLEDKKKISLFCNLNKKNIIQALNVNSIYEIPSLFFKQKLDDRVLECLRISNSKLPNLKNWINIIEKQKSLNKSINVGIVGKYIELKDAYKSLVEALIHSGIAKSTKININWIDASDLVKLKKKILNLNGIIVPGGFGTRAIQGKMYSIKYARENHIPFLGICFGMQLAVIDIAKNLLKIKNASSSEFNKNKSKNVIGLLTEWFKDGKSQKRDKNFDYGGTMRLGTYSCKIKKKSMAYKIYLKNVVRERHRHRYEMNIKYERAFQEVGLEISGKSPDGKLPEIIELKNHPWFLGVQFHPELLSRPLNPHPIFNSFIKACIKNK
ncbi:MAG: CTP synthetase [Pelagibacterales bacterium]|nr:CTP synthetase [Pelagibacterales bacterium]